MKINVGNTDRILRIIAGVAIIGAGIYFNSLWGAIGLIPLLTGIFRFCPAYKLLGMNTCPNR